MDSGNVALMAGLRQVRTVYSSLLSEHVIMILELGPLHGMTPMHHSDLYLEACLDYKSGSDIESELFMSSRPSFLIYNLRQLVWP